MQTSWMRHLESADLRQVAAGQEGWVLQYEQLSPGALHAELQLVQLPGVRLLLERHDRALRQRGRLAPDSYGFALALDADGCDALRFAGQRARHDTLMMGRGDDIDLCTPPGLGLIALVVERALLAPLWQQLYGKPLARWLEHPATADSTPVRAAGVRALHLQTLAQLRADPALLHDAPRALRLRDALLLEWIEAIPERVDAGDLPERSARRLLVERARQCLAARPESPPTLDELARALGVSARKLGYCFNEVLGLSPGRYLRLWRLNAARHALLQPRDAGLGVQDVAAGLGFWHFGQFAADYRQHFGERPSDTLRAARGAAVEPVR